MSDLSVIIPVYGNESAATRCIDSVIAGLSHEDYRVIVVDDNSPDEGLPHRLETLCAGVADAQFISHDSNRGFAAAVTSGVAACEGDVVILNSDTMVPGGWLERLRGCAARSPRAATVTPFTNAGAICSYPYFCEDAALPDGMSLDAVDALFQTENNEESLEIPTGVGFCMYINRQCWNEIGGFDIDNFGAGYGEETDFCMRAADAGWKHVLCADLFVYHEGGRSFGEQRKSLMRKADRLMDERHPAYGEVVEQFLIADPAASFRQRVDSARASIAGQAEVLEIESRRKSRLAVENLAESRTLAVERLRRIRSLEEQALEQQGLLNATRERFAELETEAERRSTAYRELEADYATLAEALEQQTRQTASTGEALEKLQREFAVIFKQRDDAALARDQARHLLQEYTDSIHKLESAVANLEALATEKQQHIETMDAMWGVRLQRRIERLRGS